MSANGSILREFGFLLPSAEPIPRVVPSQIRHGVYRSIIIGASSNSWHFTISPFHHHPSSLSVTAANLDDDRHGQERKEDSSNLLRSVFETEEGDVVR